MPQTFKDPAVANPPQGNSARPSVAQRAEESARPQPVALEVPVTVNGARAMEDSDKREPFSETTRTVLVFANGAVIRLASAVAPGQLLFLTNENTKKEVVCQVVKSKNYRNVSGYVELEFTQPIIGFWGMRFPNERVIATTPATAAPAAGAPPANQAASGNSVSAAPAAVGQLFASEGKPGTPVPPLSKITIPPPAAPPQPRAEKETIPGGFAKERSASGNSSDLFAPVTDPWHGDGTASKAQNPRPAGETPARVTHAAVPASLASPSTEPVRPQESPEAGSLAAKPDDARSAASIFEEEGIPVPSWFDPSARKSPQSQVQVPVPVASQPDSTSSLADEIHPIPLEKVKRISEAFVDSSHAPTPAAAEHAEFGSPLFLDQARGAESTRKRSGRSLTILSIAAVLVVAIAGGTWYVRQQMSFAHPAAPGPNTPSVFRAGSAPNIRARSASTQSVPAQIPSATAANPGASPALKTAISAAGANSATSAPKSPRSAATEAANLRESARAELKTLQKAGIEKQSATADKQPAVVQKEPAKKTSLPEIRLSKPIVARQAAGSRTAEPEINPASDVSAPAISADPSASALVTSQPSAPAAPKEDLPVGGDVKPARLISSVTPVYPPAARNLRVSGDVVIDAQIDANGRVTAMKVASGPPMLHQAAMDAVRQWKYTPATLDGKPVAMHMSVTVRFRLH